MIDQDKEDFYQAKRIFAESIVNIFENHGGDSARKNLEELFSSITMHLFPKELTKENLYDTIVGLKRSEIVYRDENINNLI